MPDKTNLKARHAAVVNAIASQQMAGLEPDAQVILDLQRFVRGECELDEALNNFKARIARGEVFK